MLNRNNNDGDDSESSPTPSLDIIIICSCVRLPMPLLFPCFCSPLAASRPDSPCRPSRSHAPLPGRAGRRQPHRGHVARRVGSPTFLVMVGLTCVAECQVVTVRVFEIRVTMASPHNPRASLSCAVFCTFLLNLFLCFSSLLDHDVLLVMSCKLFVFLSSLVLCVCVFVCLCLFLDSPSTQCLLCVSFSQL